MFFVMILLVINFGQGNNKTENSKNFDESFKVSESKSDEPIFVSIIQLIANPEKYDGKIVSIIGFVNMEFEGNAVYLHSEDWQNILYSNSLWLEIPKDIEKDKDKYNHRYVVIVGKFNAKKHGHMGLWSGEIENIEHFKVWHSIKNLYGN